MGLFGAIGDVVGGLLGGSGASDAAEAQVKALKQAMGDVGNWYRVSTNWLDPFIQAGYKMLPYQQSALQNYMGLATAGPGQFEESPYYQSLQNAVGLAGEQLNRAAVARGKGPGSYAQNLSDYGQQQAGNFRSQWINEWLASRLNPLYNVAFGANQYAPLAGQAANIAYNTGQSMAQLRSQIGAAKAGGILGQASAYGGMARQVGGQMDNIAGNLVSALF